MSEESPAKRRGRPRTKPPIEWTYTIGFDGATARALRAAAERNRSSIAAEIRRRLRLTLRDEIFPGLKE